jgi:hypothetical protein
MPIALRGSRQKEDTEMKTTAAIVILIVNLWSLMFSDNSLRSAFDAQKSSPSGGGVTTMQDPPDDDPPVFLPPPR